MPKMLCVKDQIEFRAHKNETYVIEMADFGPYKIWMADTWKCPACGIEVIAGFGQRCISEHYQDDFDGLLQRLKNSGARIEYDYASLRQRAKYDHHRQ